MVPYHNSYIHNFDKLSVTQCDFGPINVLEFANKAGSQFTIALLPTVGNQHSQEDNIHLTQNDCYK